MLSVSTFMGFDASEWTAIGTVLLAFLTGVLAVGAVITAVYVRREHAATKERDEKRDEVEERRRATDERNRLVEEQNRLADALERAAHLRVEAPNLNGSNRMALWTDGPHSFLAVRVTWLSIYPPRESDSATDTIMPDGFNLNPGAARSSLELPGRLGLAAALRDYLLRRERLPLPHRSER